MIRRLPRVVLVTTVVVTTLYGALLIPETTPTIPFTAPTQVRHPFAWNQDAFWNALEENYVHARAAGCQSVTPAIGNAVDEMHVRIARLRRERFKPGDMIFTEIEQLVFQLGPWVGACPSELPSYVDLVSRVREAVKRQSERWDMEDRTARETMYRLLYGGRTAVEEVILQMPPESQPGTTTPGTDEPSNTPSSRLLDVTIRSGDILVSRGGAPTSALIARGNDFPGNFSHIALVYIDAVTRRTQLIEAHIERGVTVSSLDDYMRDTKLRIMVLRPRADLPALRADPLLPHRAAEAALRRALAHHIPYDFALDPYDTTAMYCSKVVSDAYARFGIHLWMGLSQITSKALREWLAGFGVRHFDTQEPSDLEYDPQLSVVAEWRDMETLRKDHQDNAVTEAILDAAERGLHLHYQWYLLPLARLAKAYSALLNRFGAVGPVPEGMSATAALRDRWYSSLHGQVLRRVEAQAATFRSQRGYPPPYWRLVRMASDALRELGATGA